MFAVIKTGGKQYRVEEGDVLEVEKLEVKKDQKVTFEHILLVDDEKTTLVGNPVLANARVQAVVLDNFRDEKIIIFKKKRRKQYRKTRGHRQALTRVKIEKILVGKEAVAKPKPAEEKKPTEKPVAVKPAPSKRAKPKAAGPRKTPAKKPAKGATAVKANVAPKSAKPKFAPAKKKTDAKVAKSKTKTKES